MKESVQPPPNDPAAPALDRVAGVLDRLFAAADVRKAYGEPLRRGDLTLVPAAEVIAIAGFGMGSGSGARSSAAGAPRGQGGGGGGGGRTLARSVAVVVVSPEGVRVQPVVDVTKIALAALTAAGFVFATWLRLSRGGHAPRFLRGRA